MYNMGAFYVLLYDRDPPSIPIGPDRHLPFFGNMARVLRPEQAVVLLDERGFDVNATDAVSYTGAM